MFRTSKTYLIIISLYSSLLIGFYFGEDSLGGALNDFKALSHVSDKFRLNFSSTLLSYDDLGHRHSPVFFIFKSFLPENDFYSRLLFLHIFLLIPFYFYKSLVVKYPLENKKNIILISSVLMLFPTFRSYSIWPDPHLMGTLFFAISVYYFLKFIESPLKINNFLINILFLAISSYFSPNFGTFVIYFLYEFIKLKRSYKEILIVLFLNLILSLPFFYYLFVLEANFIFNDSGWDIGTNIFSLNNISNKFIILNSLIFFYTMPFLLYSLNLYELYTHVVKKYFILLSFVLIYILFAINFDFQASYNLTNSGGGFVYNISQLLFKNNYLLFLVGLFGFIFLADSFVKNLSNVFLFLSLILSNPQTTLWQANFSPLLFVVILLLLDHSILKNLISKKNIVICFIYFFIYLLSNVIYKNGLDFEKIVFIT